MVPNFRPGLTQVCRKFSRCFLPLPHIPGLKDHLVPPTPRPQFKQAPSPNLGKLFHRLSLQLPPQAHTRSFCTHAPCRGGLWLLFKPFNKPFNNFNNNNIYFIIIIIIIIRLRAMASWELLHISYCRGNETQPFHFFSCFENTA